jgi:hypothetical protein
MQGAPRTRPERAAARQKKCESPDCSFYGLACGAYPRPLQFYAHWLPCMSACALCARHPPPRRGAVSEYKFRVTLDGGRDDQKRCDQAHQRRPCSGEKCRAVLPALHVVRLGLLLGQQKVSGLQNEGMRPAQLGCSPL